jgi:hypothetical protein
VYSTRKLHARAAWVSQASTASRTRWRAIYDEVRHRHADGQMLLGIAYAMGLARATMRKYAATDIPPAGCHMVPAPSLLDAHASYLERRIGDGCENAMVLWREIQARGHPSTRRQIHRFVAGRNRPGQAASSSTRRLPRRSGLRREAHRRPRDSSRGSSSSRSRLWMWRTPPR